jgi:hypothetical protein|nr:MAG TPA: Protein of unknown function (DUF4236) [Caudoviricetes sp.]
MAIRFRKSIKILPSIKLNLSKTGISVSAGVRGTYATAGLPVSNYKLLKFFSF